MLKKIVRNKPVRHYWIDTSIISEEDFLKLPFNDKLEHCHHPLMPAYVTKLCEAWIQYGKFHRLDGPALDILDKEDTFVIMNGIKDEYHILGIRIAEEDFREAVKYYDENGEVAFILKYKENN